MIELDFGCNIGCDISGHGDTIVILLSNYCDVSLCDIERDIGVILLCYEFDIGCDIEY